MRVRRKVLEGFAGWSEAGSNVVGVYAGDGVSGPGW